MLIRQLFLNFSESSCHFWSWLICYSKCNPEWHTVINCIEMINCVLFSTIQLGFSHIEISNSHLAFYSSISINTIAWFWCRVRVCYPKRIAHYLSGLWNNGAYKFGSLVLIHLASHSRLKLIYPSTSIVKRFWQI